MLATDEDGARWVLPDAAGVYPGRGMYVAPSRVALAQAALQGEQSVRLDLTEQANAMFIPSLFPRRVSVFVQDKEAVAIAAWD